MPKLPPPPTFSDGQQVVSLRNILRWPLVIPGGYGEPHVLVPEGQIGTVRGRRHGGQYFVDFDIPGASGLLLWAGHLKATEQEGER